jgi:16S rRNA (uracil1498-N3)-methyltransferase
MRVPRLCLPGLSLTAGPLDTTVDVDAERAHYLSNVLRRRPGDAVVVFDGDGRSVPATLQSHGRRGGVLALRGVVAEEAPPVPRLGVALALVKGAALDQAVREVTELGASDIALVASERAERRAEGERADNLRRHLEGVARAACEQCGRDRLPRIAPPLPLPDFLATSAATAGCVRWVLVPGAPPPAAGALDGCATFTVLSGPEGGFSAAEAAAAEAAGFVPVGLGPRILRAVTAPVVALALAQYLCGGFAAVHAAR